MYFNTPSNRHNKKFSSQVAERFLSLPYQIQINSEPSFDYDSRVKLPSLTPKYQSSKGNLPNNRLTINSSTFSRSYFSPASRYGKNYYMRQYFQQDSYSMMPTGRFDSGSLTSRRNHTINPFQIQEDSPVKRSGLSQLISSPNMDFNMKSNPYLMPLGGIQPFQPIVMVKGRKDEKLLKRIKGQNDLIEQLASKMQEQERIKQSEQQNILDEKLRMMQIELQVKAKNEAEHHKKKKSRKKRKDNNIMMDMMMAKLMMGDDSKDSGHLMALLARRRSDSSSNSSPSPGQSTNVEHLNQLLMERDALVQQQALLQANLANDPYSMQGAYQNQFQPQAPYGGMPNQFGPPMPLRYQHRNFLPPVRGMGGQYMRPGPYGPYPPRYPGPFGRGPFNPYMPYQNFPGQQQQPDQNNQKQPEKKKEEEEEEEEEEKKPKRRMTIKRVTIKPEKINMKKVAAKLKLKMIGWTMVYPRILSVDLMKKSELRRKAVISSIESNLGNNLNRIEDWIKESTGKQIVALLTEKKSVEIFHPTKSVGEKDLEARATILTSGIKQIFDKLINATNEESISQPALYFLCKFKVYFNINTASLSENNGVIPNGFLTEFELKRVQWTNYATLKNMSDKTSKMIIGCLVIFRILIFKFIMSAWEVFGEIEENKANKVTLITVGSIIYQAMLDFFRINLQVYPNNMNFLPPEMKITPRPIQMNVVGISFQYFSHPSAMNPYVSADDPVKPNKDEPILGLLTKDLMKNYVITKKKMYDEVKSNVDGWLTKIYELTHKVYSNTPKDKKYLFGVLE